MDKVTLRALRASIAKWDKIAEGKGGSRGEKNCALCKLYWRDDCERCPVMLRTGKEFCQGTPYEGFGKLAAYHLTQGEIARTPEAKARAKEEADFLRSLLPPPEDGPK